MKQTYEIADRQVAAAPEGQGRIVVYSNPNENERRFLVEELQIDDHTLASALDPVDPVASLPHQPGRSVPERRSVAPPGPRRFQSMSTPSPMQAQPHASRGASRMPGRGRVSARARAGRGRDECAACSRSARRSARPHAPPRAAR